MKEKLERLSISKKIQKLIREGYSSAQASAIAYDMARKGRLGPRGGKKKNPVHFRNDPLVLRKWFERDRKWVALVNAHTDEVVIEFWDNAVDEAIEDGFLDPKNFHKSLMALAIERKLVWGEDRPETKKNPTDDKDVQACIRALIYLSKRPEDTEAIKEHVLDAIEAEGLWTYEKGVTRWGRQFLQDCGVDLDDESYPE